MRNHLTTILTLIFFSLTLTGLLAQPPRRSGQARGAMPKAIVKGQIIDAESAAPLEYATVTLFAKKDSSMVTGAITDDKGIFNIETRPGRFYATIEFIGYESLTINDVGLNKDKLIADLGVVQLGASSLVLDEVEIRAEKSQMQLSLDKRVFNVGKDLANKGGSAEDILDNVPSLQVDIDGAVSLRGNSNVRILVDGKPSGLIGMGDTGGLKNIPANIIDKVEVITNPSARYEAEGMTGIVNIVLRKDRQKGLNGSFDLSVGYPENYGAAVNMNLRRKNFNLFGSYGLRYRSYTGGGNLYQEFYKPDTTFILEETRDDVRGGLSHSFRFGSDFFLNPKNTLTAALTYRISNDDDETKLSYKDYHQVGGAARELFNYSQRKEIEEEDESNLEYSLRYEKKFDKKDQKFTADISYESDSELGNSRYFEEYLNLDGSPSELPILEDRSSNDEGWHNWLFEAGYVHPFAESRRYFPYGLEKTG